MKVECGQVKKCGHKANRWRGIQGEETQSEDVSAQSLWGDLQEAEQSFLQLSEPDNFDPAL